MAPQNNYNNNVKDHWSQIAVTNTTTVKKFEMLWELAKCDPETGSEQMLLGRWRPSTCSTWGCHRPSVCDKCHLWTRDKTRSASAAFWGFICSLFIFLDTNICLLTQTALPLYSVSQWPSATPPSHSKSAPCHQSTFHVILPKTDPITHPAPNFIFSVSS